MYLTIFLYFIPFRAFTQWPSLAHGILYRRQKSQIYFLIDEVFVSIFKLFDDLQKVSHVDLGCLEHK